MGSNMKMRSDSETVLFLAKVKTINCLLATASPPEILILVQVLE